MPVFTPASPTSFAFEKATLDKLDDCSPKEEGELGIEVVVDVFVDGLIAFFVFSIAPPIIVNNLFASLSIISAIENFSIPPPPL